MTLKEVLQKTADMLGNIQVPAVLAEQVALPISRAMSQLTECIAAIERDEQKAAEEAEADEGVD